MISPPVTGTVDPAALRQELSIEEPADIRSPLFLRFIIRLSELLDRDIPPADYPLLASLGGCIDYLDGSKLREVQALRTSPLV